MGNAHEEEQHPGTHRGDPRDPGDRKGPSGMGTSEAKQDSRQLTPPERDVAALVSEGLTNQQVARRLHRSPHTVNFHLRNIFRKLDVRSRVELAVYVHRRPPR
jgi:DNA-binding CsgD family transcriptional regulator